MVHRFVFKVSIFRRLAIASTLSMIPLNAVLADTSSTDYIFLINSDRQSCQQMGEDYQEIGAFETNSFYVNICQKDNNYYYLGEAKTGNINTIFLPANALAPGEMYRASNGNVAYIVTILANKAILTVERNGEQVAIENSLEPQCDRTQDMLRSIQAPTDGWNVQGFLEHRVLPFDGGASLSPIPREIASSSYSALAGQSNLNSVKCIIP
jgi:hypothetical protein